MSAYKVGSRVEASVYRKGVLKRSVRGKIVAVRESVRGAWFEVASKDETVTVRAANLTRY